MRRDSDNLKNPNVCSSIAVPPAQICGGCKPLNGGEVLLFQSGNLAAVTHGARSPRIVAQRTQQIVAGWQQLGLPMTHPLDGDALWATASAVAILEDYVSWLEAPDARGRRRGAVDSRGRERGAARRFWTAYHSVMRGLAQLGATPAGRAEMGPGVAAAMRGKVALAEMLKQIKEER